MMSEVMSSSFIHGTNRAEVVVHGYESHGISYRWVAVRRKFMVSLFTYLIWAIPTDQTVCRRLQGVSLSEMSDGLYLKTSSWIWLDVEKSVGRTQTDKKDFNSLEQYQGIMFHRPLVILLLLLAYLNGILFSEGAVAPSPSPICPPMETPGLLQSNNLTCGPKPTRRNIVVRPSDNVRDVVAGARERSFIFFSQGNYSNGIENIIPPSGVTLWAEPGTVTFQGGNCSRAFLYRQNNVGVRIYGIGFQGYNVSGYDGVITAATNSASDAFNDTADPLYGFNPSNEWSVDCCTFQEWTSQDPGSVGNAINCGSGMIIRGNTFLNGEGLGVSCFAKEVIIDGNHFEKIQMRRPFDSGHCGAIKITAHKRSNITNNYFKSIGCKAIWLDNNCENVYIAHNEAYNLGRSFLHMEIAGAGTVAEYNKVVGFGWNEIVGNGVSFNIFACAVFHSSKSLTPLCLSSGMDEGSCLLGQHLRRYGSSTF